MDYTELPSPHVTPIFPKKAPDRLSWPAPSPFVQGAH